MGFRSLGFGLGLRGPHYADVVGSQHEVEWFEALTENYLGLPGHGPGPFLPQLLEVRKRFPVAFHGVSLSLGGQSPFDEQYLRSVDELIREVQPEWVSDHLCFTGVHGRNAHDLLPLPYTRQTINHLVSRIQRVQERWKRPLVLENVSSYVSFRESEMTEWEFVRAVVKEAGAFLLLDVNNVYVSSRNHGFPAERYFDDIPWDRVVQFHLAGHTDKGSIVIDTHDAPVRPEVWELYRKAAALAPHASTMIERDANIPPFRELESELLKARAIHRELH
jgi:uncharacterized protein